MTYQSLFIEEHSDRASAEATYVPGRNGKLWGSLNAVTWRVSVGAFAATHNLPIYYVDNCWMRVAMDATSLRRFLADGVAGDGDAVRLIALLEDDRWYVVNDEEF